MPVSAGLGAGLSWRLCQGHWLAGHRICSSGQRLGQAGSPEEQSQETAGSAPRLLYGTVFVKLLFSITIFHLDSK